MIVPDDTPLEISEGIWNLDVPGRLTVGKPGVLFLHPPAMHRARVGPG